MTTDQQTEVERLRAFANDIWEYHTGSFDGCDLEDLAEKHGLIERVEVTQNCGEDCACAEFGFPAQCLRKTALLVGPPPAAQEGNDVE